MNHYFAKIKTNLHFTVFLCSYLIFIFAYAFKILTNKKMLHLIFDLSHSQRDVFAQAEH